MVPSPPMPASPALDTSPLEALIDQQQWLKLVALLTEKKWDKTAAQWLPIVQLRLEARIPDEQRRWAQEWYTLKSAPAATPIVRYLALPPRTQGAMQKFTRQLGTLDQSTMPPLTHFVVTDYARKDRVELSLADAQLLWEKLALARLRHVEFHAGPANAPLLDTLFSAEALRAVEELDLRQVSHGDLSRLASCSALGALRILRGDLRASGALDAPAFARSFAGKLERLELSLWSGWIQTLDPDGALWSVPWPRLQRLSLSWDTWTPHRLSEIVTAAPELTVLVLRRCALGAGPSAAGHEGARPHASLKKLWLSGCEVSDGDLAALLRHPACASLTELVLHEQRSMGPATAAAIEGLPALEQLSIETPPMPGDAAWGGLRARHDA
jgi:hypothetical protein